MKKFINFLLIFSILITDLFIINIDVNAETITTITAVVNDQDGVYLRKGAATSYDDVALLTYGKSVTLVSKTKYDTDPNDSCTGWYQVKYNGTTNNYVCSLYVNVRTTTYDNSYYTTASWKSRINENYATVRNKPNGTMIERIYLGTDVEVLSTSGEWAKISYYDNRTGYIYKRLISNYNDITDTDEAYYNELKNKGFPESYLPFLTYLHKKYPNWIFKPSITNKKFDNVVTNEVGKNYIQTSESTYRASGKIKENPNWYAASTAVVAFFLDPTNYLTEKNIFAFEELTYDEVNHTSQMVKNVFSGTYLDTDEYIGYFMEAANTYKVSPVHLATRVSQEGAASSTYAAITGTATSVSGLKYRDNDLDGVYNYYNIGSYQDSYTDSSVTRGLAAAKGLVDSNEGTPWDTRQKAIVYGAKFIANGYIAKKQDTLYYQKFNTAPNAYYSSYTHQYMTNIIAPASESLSTFESYSKLADFTNSTFTFSIPVYQDMPDGYTSHPTIGDTNNNLSNILVNNTSITGFDNDILEYVYYVNKDTTTLELTATTESSNALISGTGTINLTNVNEKEVTITVTSATGTIKNYKITFIKIQNETPSDTDLTVDKVLENVDVKFNENYMSGITEATTATKLNNDIKSQYPDITVTITDKDNNNKTGILKTGDKIKIKTTSDEKSYTIVIKGDTNGDGIINAVDLLRVQKHILKYNTLENEFLEACDTNYDNAVEPVDLLRVQKHILKYIKLK